MIPGYITKSLQPSPPCPTSNLPAVLFARRMCALVLLTTCLGGAWTVEQPGGSLMDFFPTWRFVVQNLFRVGGPAAVRSSVFLVPKHLNQLQCVKYLIVPFPIDWHVLFQVLLVHVSQCCTYWPTISALWFPYAFWFPTNFELVEPKVSTVKWWMQHYKAPTAKRHYGYANSPVVRRLDRGTLQRTKHGSDQQKIQTCEKYYDGSGKLRYKGTRHLKGTEPLSSNSNCFPVKTDGVPGNSHSS